MAVMHALYLRAGGYRLCLLGRSCCWNPVRRRVPTVQKQKLHVHINNVSLIHMVSVIQTDPHTLKLKFNLLGTHQQVLQSSAVGEAAVAALVVVVLVAAAVAAAVGLVVLVAAAAGASVAAAAAVCAERRNECVNMSEHLSAACVTCWHLFGPLVSLSVAPRNVGLQRADLGSRLGDLAQDPFQVAATAERNTWVNHSSKSTESSRECRDTYP